MGFGFWGVLVVRVLEVCLFLSSRFRVCLKVGTLCLVWVCDDGEWMVLDCVYGGCCFAVLCWGLPLMMGRSSGCCDCVTWHGWFVGFGFVFYYCALWLYGLMRCYCLI